MKNDKKITCPRAVIRVYEFQPFAERAQAFPDSKVIALDFVYDPRIISLVKSAIGLYHKLAINKSKLIKQAGGWLKDFKIWFVEPSVWPLVKQILVAANIEIQGENT